MMSKFDNLVNFQKNRHCTMLGVGPMSKNCVDATIEIANEFSIPLIMIASRRQIDAEVFGGGYVNNWTTEEYSKYVRENDHSHNIFLARDHGGPWQNTIEVEKSLNLDDAMESAKKSFEEDIINGFDIIHIDPSIDIFNSLTLDDILERIFELFIHCHEFAKKNNKELIYEIGTEEQSGGTNTKEELIYALEKIKTFCSKNNINFPQFVVIQTGTKVMETRNIGSFESPLRLTNELPSIIQVPMMIDVCNQYNIWMKEHNTDYLNNHSLEWHPKLGIHSANVAPEFGVAETKAFIEVLQDNSLTNLLDEFLELSYQSNKWKKWLVPNSKATTRECAIISGHYVFGSSEFKEINSKASKQLQKLGIDLDKYLKNKVKDSIMRYVKCFRIA